MLPTLAEILKCACPSLKLTETSSRYARKISGTTALQEALKEKQQHIEQLLAERDLERAEVAKATSHVGEIEQQLALARDGHDQVHQGGLLAEVVNAKEEASYPSPGQVSG